MSSAISTTHAAPADQPTGVRQITDRLFPAYTIDEGSVRLAGCSLEDRVFVCLTYRRAGQSMEIHVDHEGQPIDPETIRALGMAETIRLAVPPKSKQPDLSEVYRAGAQWAEEHLPGTGPLERVGATVIWCKYAEGKLRFTVRGHAAELAFSGWARSLEPPPFVCPHTGQSTFHLAATDDGRIVPADQIETCEETSQRMLSTDLATCVATGQRVASELVVTCPVSSDQVLESQAVRCGTCRQMVSPTTTERGQCTACRQLQPVDKADPRMARLLDEHPRLDRWAKWRMAETANVYILVAVGWMKRLLLVVDKDSLELKLLATGNRFLSGWQEVDPDQYQYVL